MKSEFRDLSLAWDKEQADDEAGSGDEFVYNAEPQFRYSDDSAVDPQVERQLAHLMDTITRVGGVGLQAARRGGRTLGTKSESEGFLLSVCVTSSRNGAT